MLRLTLFGERLTTFAFLVIFAGVFWPPTTYFTTETRHAGASNPYDFAAFSILIPFLVIAFFANRGELWRLGRAAWPVLALCALAFISAFWADDQELVIRRAGTLTATALFGIYLAGRGDFGAVVRMLVKVYALAALISLVLVAAVPQLGTTTTGDMYVHSWCGVFTDKNELGLACAIGILVAGYAFAVRQGPRWLSAFTLAACLLLLYGSQSKTPVVMIVFAFYAGFVGSALRRRSGAGLVAGFLLIVAGLAGAAGLTFGWDAVLAMLGRNATFTNRAKIWHYAQIFIAHRPWLGYGFGGFWREHGVEANQFWKLVEFQTPHAHNAWLEVGLGLGIVGIAVAALAWVAAFTRGLRALARPDARHAPFCLAMLAGIFVENLTEYEFLRQGHMMWVLFAAVSAYLGQQVLVVRRRAIVPSEALPVPARA